MRGPDDFRPCSPVQGLPAPASLPRGAPGCSSTPRGWASPVRRRRTTNASGPPSSKREGRQPARTSAGHAACTGRGRRRAEREQARHKGSRRPRTPIAEAPVHRRPGPGRAACRRSARWSGSWPRPPPGQRAPPSRAAIFAFSSVAPSRALSRSLPRSSPSVGREVKLASPAARNARVAPARQRRRGRAERPRYRLEVLTPQQPQRRRRDIRPPPRPGPPASVVVVHPCGGYRPPTCVPLNRGAADGCAQNRRAGHGRAPPDADGRLRRRGCRTRPGSRSGCRAR